MSSRTSVPFRHRGTGLAAALVAIVAAGLLLGACSGMASSSSAATSGGQADTNGQAAAPAPMPPAPAAAAGGADNGAQRTAFGAPLAGNEAGGGAAGSSKSTGTLLKLTTPGQAISYTAGLTVRSKDVSAAASQAVADVTGAGGYVASEQQVKGDTSGQSSTVSLDLRIPAAQYSSVLTRLRTDLGTEISFTEQAQDMTQQVADVSSRVDSARAAIAQLRALLSRAGSVSDLLSVQNEINSQQSDLESLLAQQAALAHQTSYATVGLSIIGPKTVAHQPHHAASGGFLGGLRGGWHALTVFFSWLLTVVGALLPFAIPVAVLLAAAWLIRRRIRRHGSAGPAGPAAPAAAGPGTSA